MVLNSFLDKTEIKQGKGGEIIAGSWKLLGEKLSMSKNYYRFPDTGSVYFVTFVVIILPLDGHYQIFTSQSNDKIYH